MTAASTDERFAVILAYHFPPMVGAPSSRAAALARHLPASGWTPIVVTVRSGHFHRDPRQEVPPVSVDRTASPEIARAVHALQRRRWRLDASVPLKIRSAHPEVRPAHTGSFAGAARQFIREWIYVPDGRVGWIPFAAGAARRALASTPGPAVLVSTSPPISAHLAASVVAARKRIPWVAEVRDPWSTDSDRVRPRSAARRRLDRAIEAMVVRRADAVVVTADRTAAEFGSAHPTLGPENVHVIRNGFEPQELDGSPPTRRDRLTFVFVGSVPEFVSVEPLVAAMSRVARRRPGEFTLRVLGPAGPWEAAAERVGDVEWLQLEGLTPPSHARAAASSASVNVLWRPREEDALIVAAKLYEYLGARRPILAILPEDSEMESLGRRFGDLRAVHSYDVGELERAVNGLIDEHRSGSLERAVEPPEPLEELSWETQVGRFGELLDELVAARGG